MGKHFRILLRQILKQKLYTIITVGSLATGLAVGLLSAAYAKYELTYDQFTPRQDKLSIYRVGQSAKIGARDETQSPFLINEDVIGKMELLPEVKRVCRLFRCGALYEYQGRRAGGGMILGDDSFFDFFPVPAKQGDLSRALSQPGSIVLTESLARKLFVQENPLGRVVTVGKRYDYKVTAVTSDWPGNSHLKVEAVVRPTYANSSLFGLYMRHDDGRVEVIKYYDVYLLVPAAADLRMLEKKLSLLSSERIARTDVKTTLTALRDIYMSSETSQAGQRHGDMKRIYLLLAITVFTLLIAGVNYVNLSTARASRRAAEIGIKKIIGAGRARLFGSFLLESVLITALASGLAGLLAWLLLPLARRLLLVEFSLAGFFGFPVILFAGLGVLLIGLLAGLYPALVLSGFRPLSALQQSRPLSGRSNRFGRFLIILQFTIATVFIAGALVISRQLDFVSRLDLGYNHNCLLNVRFGGTYPLPADSFHDRLLRNPLIEGVAFSHGIPGGIRVQTPLENANINTMMITPDFLPVFQIQLKEGRNLLPGDSGRACLINEAAVRLPGEGPPLGKKLCGREIVGVVKNFHYASVHVPVEPLVMDAQNTGLFEDATIRLRPENLHAAMGFIRDLWKELYPGVDFNFTFYDDDLDRLYRSEQRLGELIRYSALIAILMSCSGLVGLALFTTGNRMREIGIRKVFGASTGRIVRLLTRNFAGMVLVAILAACPLAWYLMGRWLENFSRRIELSWDLFLLTGGLTLAVALLTVASLVFRAARTNPVRTLRHE